jgi:hypothetical protein
MRIALIKLVSEPRNRVIPFCGNRAQYVRNLLRQPGIGFKGADQ